MGCNVPQTIVLGSCLCVAAVQGSSRKIAIRMKAKTLGENYEKPDPSVAPGFTSVSDPAGMYGGLRPDHAQPGCLHQQRRPDHQLRRGCHPGSGELDPIDSDDLCP